MLDTATAASLVVGSASEGRDGNGRVFLMGNIRFRSGKLEREAVEETYVLCFLSAGCAGLLAIGAGFRRYGGGMAEGRRGVVENC